MLRLLASPWRCCGYLLRLFGMRGVQPERLKAEGFSLSALSRGWSVSATLGMPTTPKKSVWRTRMLSPRKPIFASFRRIIVGVTIPRVSLRSTLGYEPLAALGRSTFQVVLPVFLPRIFSDSVMKALTRIYAGDCARRKSRRCLLLCGLRIFANFAE